MCHSAALFIMTQLEFIGAVEVANMAFAVAIDFPERDLLFGFARSDGNWGVSVLPGVRNTDNSGFVGASHVIASMIAKADAMNYFAKFFGKFKFFTSQFWTIGVVKCRHFQAQ
jgi:hypothetical protein